jgi:hypothetical protein
VGRIVIEVDIRADKNLVGRLDVRLRLKQVEFVRQTRFLRIFALEVIHGWQGLL